MSPTVPAFAHGRRRAGCLALRFGVLSLIGTVIYVTAVASIGYSLGLSGRRWAGPVRTASRRSGP